MHNQNRHFRATVGASISHFGSTLIVVGTGPVAHSGGCGLVDHQVVDPRGRHRPGAILNTPFGQCEVMELPRHVMPHYMQPDVEEFAVSMAP